MIYSQKMEDMENSAEANARIAFDMCAAIGLPLGIANTLRDQEYQTYLHKNGKAPARVTFHGKGLAIDIYIKIKGHEYDTSLYPKVAEIFKKVGFSWMWDIAHNEMCHFQWDNHRAVTGQDILKGVLPPPMPLYSVTKEYKAIIQAHMKMSDPDRWWKKIDGDEFSADFYRKWAESYAK